MQERGKGGPTKSVHPFFWRHHSFVKMRTSGDEGGGGDQTFRFFKRTYFMDETRDNGKTARTEI